jgi:hypothetical protein
MSFYDDFLKELKKKGLTIEDVMEKEEQPSKGKSTASKSKYEQEFEAALNERGLTLQDAMNMGDEDIAPITKSTINQSDKNIAEDGNDSLLDFFQKGAFSDGYQFGDVTKTILGSAGDAGLNIFKGFANVGEGIGDAISYGVAGIADKLGKDEFAEDVRDRASESMFDDWTKGSQNYLDQYSALGRTSKSVAQGVGQMGFIMGTGGLGSAAGLGSVGTTILTTGTMGLSGMGSGMGEAYQNDATDEEALTYGLIAGASDAVTELIFGGMGKMLNAKGLSSGLSSADDVLAKKVSGLFKNQIAKNFAEFGVKASAEGMEEVMAGMAQAWGKWKTYNSEEDFWDIVKDENLLEQFVVGMATSGMMQSGIIPGTESGSLKEANATGRDFITGLSQNEQAVIDKETEKRIAEQEASGKKLTNKEKSDIAEKVKKDMEKGYISTDTIEEALGGETYKTYKHTIDSEVALQKEFDTLNKMKQGEMTGEQIDKRTELKEKLEYLKKNSKRSELKTKLGEEVKGLIQNDRLTESYNEIERHKQRIELDLNQYKNPNARKTAENLAKVLDNSNKARDVLDLMTKVSEDIGVTFTAEDAQNFEGTAVAIKRVKEFAADGKTTEYDIGSTNLSTGFKPVVTVDGKVVDNYSVDYKTGKITFETAPTGNISVEFRKDAKVNGKLADGSIAINMKSKKYLESIVGHEVTHKLENTGFYAKLQEYVFEYAKKKGEYDTRYKEFADLYNGIEGTSVEAELTADLVGDYLFQDSDFINKLSTENRNVFQKLYDEIKHLLTLATAGSEQARRLEQVKHKFEQAYREAGKAQKNTADSGAAYALESKKQPGRLDPRTVTKADVEDMLHKVEEGSISGNTYIPVRIGTPEKLIYWAEKRRGDVIDNNPIAISADKAYNAMNRAGEMESGRPNKLSTDEIVAMIEGMNDPQYIVYQGANDRYVEVVKFDTKTGDKAFAVIEIGNNKDAVYMNGYEGGLYNILVTTYPPQSGKLKELLTGSSNQVIYDKNKDASQRTSGSTVPSVLNDASFYDDSLPDNGKEVKEQFSLSEAGEEVSGKSYAEITEEQLNLRDREIALQKRKQEATNNPELLQAMDDYANLFAEMRGLLPKRHQGTATQAELDRIEEIKALREERMKRVADLQESLGINAIAKEEAEIRETKEVLRKAADAAWAREGAEKENKAIEKAGVPAAEYFRKKALKAFKTTTNFNEAGYMLPDGKLLNFSGGERNHRYRDHREIGEIYEATNGTAALNRFLSDGNIRIMAESPGIDLAAGVEPTKEQYAALRRFIYSNGVVEGQFFIDFSGVNGERSGKYEYTGKIVADRIINDIKYFYENGKVRESSGLLDFLSISADTETPKKYGDRATLGEEVLYKPTEDIAPVAETAAEAKPTAPQVNTEDLFPDDTAPIQKEYAFLKAEEEDIAGAIAAYAASGDMENAEKLWSEYQAVQEKIAAIEADETDRLNSIEDADAPPETIENNPEDVADDVPLTKTLVTELAKTVRAQLGLPAKRVAEVRDLIARYSKEEFPSKAHLYTEIAEKFGTYTETQVDEDLKGVKALLRTYGIQVSDSIKGEIADYGRLMRSNFGKVRFSNEGLPVDVAYREFQEVLPGYFPESIYVPTDQLMRIIEVANMDTSFEQTHDIDWQTLEEVTDTIMNGVAEFKQNRKEALANAHGKESFQSLMEDADRYVPPLDLQKRPPTRAEMNARADDIAPTFDTSSGQQAFMPEAEEPKKVTRKELYQNIVDNIKTTFLEKGFEFDDVLKNAKDLSTFATVDNTPQRVMEKALGYKQGQALSDLTVNKVAQNETEGIRWLNSFTDKKMGLLAKISKQYNIKPESKASAAAQMYAEGFYVGENDAIIQYGDRELAMDFPDAKVQENIKKLARDPRIRQIYDETLAAINESRTRNAYPEIPRLDNYFLHFRAMEDTFSRLGLPFNPNDIRAKDLPTDLNGVTADLKPGQPYFASAKHREGKRTSFDLLGGLEKYLTSAKNQIYHIDDIQTLRALRNYVAETYGQATGLQDLDLLSDEEAEQKIKDVYGSHLSTFAKFLNEEANVLAGKTALIDRGLEGVIGRRGITFLDTLNRQVGANMVGFNVSSALTNFLAPVQAFAKSNKFDFVKAMAQTASNKIGSIFGNGDTFAEESPVMIRRKGAERFYRTPYEKVADAGYVLMGMVDDLSTELVARTKYNELTRKGMDSQQAHIETDKWVSRLMGDRSIGQQPQLYNSKMLGIVTKFQLEVRNQLDSQFYDTIQEAKVSTEDIQNGLERNAKKAAKITSTFVQLAVVQHLFGKAFESVAGYNPAFDIIEAIVKALGWDDEEDEEDTVLDNLEEAFLSLLGDLPYTSTLTGGRIPIASALPITEFIKGEDQYGNEKSRWDTIKEAAPYYLLPGGYGQIKKTKQGLQMFDEDLPIAGSYTDSGNLRFPVEDTLKNRLQAGLFGQWASANARDYFDNERKPLKENQIQELIDVDIPIREYWDYREKLSKYDTVKEKIQFIESLDLPVSKKNILVNNAADRKTPIDLTDYDQYADFEEFDFASKNPEKYSFLKENNISYADYAGDEDAKEFYDGVYSWVNNYPDKVTVSKAVTSSVVEYRKLTKALDSISADKDAGGKTINGSAKEKKIAYINSLDIDYGAKLILFKNEYNADDTYNYEIVEYLNGRDDISYDEMNTILKELGFNVTPDGYITW